MATDWELKNLSIGDLIRLRTREIAIEKAIQDKIINQWAKRYLEKLKKESIIFQMGFYARNNNQKHKIR